jgi:hypothetical protein
MRLLTTLLWIFFVLWTTPVAAQTDIHRCIDAQGNALFTDQTCVAMQATAVHPAAKPSDDITNAATIASTPTEPPPILCAGTFNELRQSVIDAFASRNANRMAGLMLWGDYGGGDAVGTIRMLSALMRQPLLDAGPPDSAEASPAGSSSTLAANSAPDPPAAGHELVLHLAGSDGSGNPRELRYGVVHRAGCLWLRAVD